MENQEREAETNKSWQDKANVGAFLNVHPKAASRSRSCSPRSPVSNCNQAIPPQNISPNEDDSKDQTYRKSDDNKLHNRDWSPKKSQEKSKRQRSKDRHSRRNHSKDRVLRQSRSGSKEKFQRHSRSGSKEKRRSGSKDRLPRRSRSSSKGRKANSSKDQTSQQSRDKRARSKDLTADRSGSKEKSSYQSRSQSNDRRKRRERSRSRDRRHHNKDNGQRNSHRESPSRHRYRRNEQRSRSPYRSKYQTKVALKVAAQQSMVAKFAEATKDIKVTDMEKPSNLPLNIFPIGNKMGVITPQLVLQQTMAAMSAQAQTLTGVALPKYYNPAAVNPLKYAEQMQKRKLLWQANKEKVEIPKVPTNHWDQTSFTHDDDGKMSAKFRKLMGLRGEKLGGAPEAASSSGTEVTTQDAITKQEALFRDLDQQYEMARMTTHTHRGVGLGYSSQPQTLIFPK